MQRLHLERAIAAPAETVVELVADVEAFTRAAGFDEVERDGEDLRIANSVGLLRIELDLELLEDADAVLAYRQRSGVFDTMTATYLVEPADDGCVVAATTEFELSAAVVGPLFDATVVRRQRRREIERQFDYLEDEATGGDVDRGG